MMGDQYVGSRSAAPAASFSEFKGECAQHGSFVAMTWRGRQTECPKCRAAREEEEARKLAEQHAHARREKALDAAGIVGRFRLATFGTFHATLPAQRVALQACKDFADAFSMEQGGGLWLIGPAGVGKTHLGSAIAQAIIFQRREKAIVATAREIVRAIRATWRDSDDTEAIVVDRFADVPCLVLDEVGVGFGTDAEITQLYDVIDVRYRKNRPTVVLSNLNEPQIKAALGDRLYERLREGSKVVACTWKSHRAKGPFVGGSEDAA